MSDDRLMEAISIGCLPVDVSLFKVQMTGLVLLFSQSGMSDKFLDLVSQILF